jgi:hypothetical protein
MIAEGKLKEPEHEIVELSGNDDEVGSTIREVMKRNEGGKGRKVLLKFV